MVVLSLTVEGEQQLQRELTRWASNIVDAQPAMQQMADLIRRDLRRQFTSEGQYGPHGRWTALSPDYARWKRRAYPGKPILQRIGALMKALTGKPAEIERIGPQSLLMGTRLRYARAHQRGTQTLPQRRIVDLRTDTKREMVKIYQRHIVEST